MMNERERLIELLSKIDYIVDDGKHSMKETIEFIADYLLENGVVVLPCKCNKCSHRCNNTNECGIYGRICTENGYCDKALKGGTENK